MSNQIKPPVWLLSFLRVLIGWHFLYEGIVKLASPSWSAGPYLLESTWIFSGFFKSLAVNQSVVGIVDFMNIWGLILIGAGLMVGMYTRIASWSGALLLFLYYIARPPFAGIMDGNISEGTYIWVNKNLIEMVALILIARTPVSWMLGLDNLLTGWWENRKKAGVPLDGSIKVPVTDNPVFDDLPMLDRRRVLKNLFTIPVVGGFTYALLRSWDSGYESYEVKDMKANAVSSATLRF
ncbi:MAG: DoxX family membrane protein, partial [Bacteroidales bacterium]|nr:DoxX family membrane protein [Bacteroidales bacterium]